MFNEYRKFRAHGENVERGKRCQLYSEDEQYRKSTQTLCYQHIGVENNLAGNVGIDTLTLAFQSRIECAFGSLH